MLYVINRKKKKQQPRRKEKCFFLPERISRWFELYGNTMKRGSSSYVIFSRSFGHGPFFFSSVPFVLVWISAFQENINWGFFFSLLFLTMILGSMISSWFEGIVIFLVTAFPRNWVINATELNPAVCYDNTLLNWRYCSLYGRLNKRHSNKKILTDKNNATMANTLESVEFLSSTSPTIL